MECVALQPSSQEARSPGCLVTGGEMRAASREELGAGCPEGQQEAYRTVELPGAFRSNKRTGLLQLHCMTAPQETVFLLSVNVTNDGGTLT